MGRDCEGNVCTSLLQFEIVIIREFVLSPMLNFSTKKYARLMYDYFTKQIFLGYYLETQRTLFYFKTTLIVVSEGFNLT